jgi:asparagine synthase (glutamine-hydrolysing)
MCGIAGYVRREGVADLAVVRAMCDTIRHRGPDDEGYHLDGPCGLGMRRLSIIDLATGHQPIANEDESVWVVFNGEIYNFRELRQDLEQRGHRFRTRTDTEVLVHLYEEEAEAGLNRLRGMFAIALWDARRQRLLLVRDRFGKKPLYYALTPGGLWFGSELKCLAAGGAPLGELDREALKLYFVFSHIPDPWSPYRAVKKLAPGGWLSYDARGVVREGRYWRLPPPAEVPLPGDSEVAAAARVRDRFDEAVRLRLVADVPLGAFLSGGIDSSAVVASMALHTSAPVKTFSIGFEEAAYNELPYARLVAEQYRTEHHEILVKPDAVALTERLVRHFDEPFGDSSAIPTFLVSEFAARHVKVALSGDGGDELYAGYESLRSVQEDARFDRIPRPLRRALGGIAAALPYAAYGKNWLRMASRLSPLERYFERNYAHYFLRRELLEPEWMLPGEEGFLTRALGHWLPDPPGSPLTQAAYFEATGRLAADMLVKVDRMSMANSLEVRCPLLDHRLAEEAAALPHAWKMQGRQGKRILIQAMADRLPAALRNRPKQGFGVPLAAWFRGPLRALLWDHLTGGAFRQRGVARPRFVEALLREHQAGRRDNSHWLWGLLMLEMWFRGREQAA